MKQEKRVIRAGVALILLATVWRLGAGESWAPVKEFFRKPDVAAFLIYLGTGRPVHPQAQAQEQTAAPTEAAPSLPAATAAQREEQQGLSFSAEDARYFSMYELRGCAVDSVQLLQQPLEWSLTGETPTVLILHTHASESYTKAGQDYAETAAYRTLDKDYNMVQVGHRLAQQLRAAGIGVLHDTTLHDYPSYTGSYSSARRTVQDYLQTYPTIRLVLDLHRDAALNPDGTQMDTAAWVDGQAAAQLMLVVGSDRAGLSHPRWRENMALAAKLHVLLEKQWQGITRPVCLRAERFNQDLLPGMLLVEVGAAGNTLQEALVSAQCLGSAIISLAQGANAS